MRARRDGSTPCQQQPLSDRTRCTTGSAAPDRPSGAARRCDNQIPPWHPRSRPTTPSLPALSALRKLNRGGAQSDTQNRTISLPTRPLFHMKHCPWTDVPGGSTAARTARDRRVPDSHSQRRFGCAALVYLASHPPAQRPRNDVIAATAPDPDTPILDCTNESSIRGTARCPAAAVAVANINALLSDRVG